MKNDLIKKIKEQLQLDILQNKIVAKKTNFGHKIELDNVIINISDNKNIQLLLKNNSKYIDININSIEELIDALTLSKRILNIKNSILK